MLSILFGLFLGTAGASTDTFTNTPTATATSTQTATACHTPTRTATPIGADPYQNSRMVVAGFYDPSTNKMIPSSAQFPFIVLDPVPLGTSVVWNPDPITVLSTSTFVMPWDPTYRAVDIQNLGTDPTDATQDIWIRWGGGTAVAGKGTRLKAKDYLSLGLPHAAEGLSAIVTSTPQSLGITRHPIR